VKKGGRSNRNVRPFYICAGSGPFPSFQPLPVIPAKAGISLFFPGGRKGSEIPAFAGMTSGFGGLRPGENKSTFPRFEAGQCGLRGGFVREGLASPGQLAIFIAW
jgi:hypothetical protein